ncbi:MAG: hypothetical protein WCS77_10345, partial [Elusimicrobiaceae bacterium]
MALLFGGLLVQASGLPVFASNVPTPVYPANSSIINYTKPNFNWTGLSSNTVVGLPEGANYVLQVADNAGFSSPIINTTVGLGNAALLSSFAIASQGYLNTTELSAGTYYWRVRFYDGTSYYDWSPAASFTIDTTGPATSGFTVKSSTGGDLGYNQIITEALVQTTATIKVQDLLSGLAVSSAALTWYGDGRRGPSPVSGFSVSYSNDGGSTWVNFSSTTQYSFPSLGGSGVPVGFVTFKGTLYGCRINNSVYTSTDGRNWVLNYSVDGRELMLYPFRGNLYLSYYYNPDGKMHFARTVNGTDWTDLGAMPFGDVWTGITDFNGRFYVVAREASNDIYASEDGTTWVKVVTDGCSMEMITTYNGRLYGSTYCGGVQTSVNGIDWTYTADVTERRRAFAIHNGLLYNSEYWDAQSIWRTSPNNDTWTQLTSYSGDWIDTFFSFGGRLYAGQGVSNAKLYYSGDGNTWINYFTSSHGNSDGMAQYKNDFLFATNDGTGYVSMFHQLPSSITGSDGTTSEQTLTANNLNFSQSRASAVCNGTSSCTATNQLWVSLTDMSGNVTNSYYSVLVDTLTAAATFTAAYPLDTQTITNASATFKWNGDSSNALYQTGGSYHFQLARDSNYSSVLVSSNVIISSAASYSFGSYEMEQPSLLSDDATYYWRVRLEASAITSPWSTHSFVYEGSAPLLYGFNVKAEDGKTYVYDQTIPNLPAQATAYINAQDLASGLAVSTSALSWAGDGHEWNGTTASGFDVSYSKDAGANWTRYSAVTTQDFPHQYGPDYGQPERITAFAYFKGKYYMATLSYIYYSDDAVTWTQGWNIGAWDGTISLYAFKDYLVVGYALGAYASSDGISFTYRYSLDPMGGGPGGDTRGLVEFNGKLYGCGYNTISSTSNGWDWVVEKNWPYPWEVESAPS